MKLRYIKLVRPIQSPHYAEPGTHTSEDVFRATDGFELEDAGQFVVIRGKCGVEVTPWANVVGGRVVDPEDIHRGVALKARAK